MNTLKPALFYENLEDTTIRCLLCPHLCQLKNGQTGICQARINHDGIMYSLNYGIITSEALDPVEKKPLYHFHPGRKIFSIGSFGCNLSCIFCQNHTISREGAKTFNKINAQMPCETVHKASRIEDNIGIAYTYNEPVISVEFILETAHLAKRLGLHNVMVTNGYINPTPLQRLLPIIDAWNVDLKAFSENFYKKLTGGSLQPILNVLKNIRKSGNHLEITHLVVTGENDNEEEFRAMVHWLHEELGPDTILHISRYHPHYKHHAPPTPPETLLKIYKIAKEKLFWVYLGNIQLSVGNESHCPKCGALLVRRSGYFTEIYELGEEGNCKTCGEHLPFIR
ncbi:MAG: pyruvate formate lyase activating enzyme [Bacteroidales bacterium]|nr:pyruvate formate lyase activating enzyme [Bacteroidales bacterium]